MPESFLSAPLIPDELELCLKSHPSLRVISFLPNFLHCRAAHRMALASLVFVRTYVPFQLSRRSKCLHSFCGSQISQNLTHFHYSRPHHPTSHCEIIQSLEVTHIWLIPQPLSLRPSSEQNVWLYLIQLHFMPSTQSGTQTMCALKEPFKGKSSHVWNSISPMFSFQSI